HFGRSRTRVEGGGVMRVSGRFEARTLLLFAEEGPDSVSRNSDHARSLTLSPTTAAEGWGGGRSYPVARSGDSFLWSRTMKAVAKSGVSRLSPGVATKIAMNRPPINNVRALTRRISSASRLLRKRMAASMKYSLPKR